MTAIALGHEQANFSLRRYRSGDLNAIYRLDCLCFAPQFRFSRRSMREFATTARALTWIAETGEGEIAGFAIIHLETSGGAVLAGYVVTLDVLPTMSRKGVATLLLRRTECEARERGASVMRLHVHTENRAAIAFYKACGYQRVGGAASFYGSAMDADLYQRDLLPPGEERRGQEAGLAR